jgi:hypothetical protein
MQMIAEVVSEEIGVTVEAKQIESQPLRMIGKHTVSVRLTVDLIPEIEIIVHREGETPEAALEEEEKATLLAVEMAEFEDYEELIPDDSDESEQTAEEALPEDEIDVEAVAEEDEKE